MNRTKLLTIAVLGLLVINLGTLVFVFFKPHPHPPHPDQMMRHGNEGPRGEGPKQIIIDRLNFDEAQQKEYLVLIEDHKSKMHELNRASNELHDQLYSLLKENAINKAAADSTIQKIAGNQKELDHLNFDHFQKIKAICNGKQVEKFNQLAGDLAGLFAPQGHPN